MAERAGDPFAGRVAIVTGASSGIGRATARALAERGCAVVAVARREERLRELAALCQKHEPRCTWIAGDLSERGFAPGMVEEAGRRLGGVDILVNNAAQPFRRPVFELSADEVERAFRVNFYPCVEATLAAIPWMLRAGGGAIVNVSSFASRVVPTFESVYAATKCAMNGFSEGIRNELAEVGIHVALVHPGPIDTEIWERGERPAGYRGVKHPPEVVATAILDAIARRRDELFAPRFSPSLLGARLLRAVAPRLLYRGVRRMDPIPRELIEAARERARAARN